MARFPGATWRPITADKGRRPMAAYNRVNLHVAVTEGSSLHAAFNRSGAVDSHFYVRRDGSAEQYVDTSMRAFADLDGNDATISIETQGGVHSADTEQWTAAQVETLAQIYAWAVRTHGIARQVAWNSQPGASSHGLSWHRLGIDGNFPGLPDVRAGRGQRGGGMHYSKSRGKLCPGGGKIQQVPTIYARALAILGGARPASAPTAKAVPASLPKVQEDNMIVVLNKSNNAAVIVSGGKVSPVVGWDQYVVLTQTLPSIGVSNAQFDAIVNSFK